MNSSPATRQINNILLTRSACNLIAQNGNPARNAQDVRQLLGKSGINPEEPHPEEDIEKAGKRGEIKRA